jgi:hypothetical protein
MSYRPYPNVYRALAQVHRHAPVLPLPDCLRPTAASFARLRVNAQRALEARLRLAALGPDDDATDLIQAIGDEQGFVQLPVDEYRLSTRPRVVSGGS